MAYQNYAGVWLQQSDASYDWLSNPSSPIQLGAGQDTVKIWQSYTLPASGVNNLIVFGDGQYAAGNDSDDVIKAEAAGVNIYGARGADVFVGSGGSGTNFIVAQGEGDKVIQNFTAADTVRLIGGPLTTFSAVQAAMTQQGSDVVLNDGGTHILFRNETIGQFQAANFRLPLNYASLGSPTFSEDFNNASTIGTNWADNYGWGGKSGLGSYTLAHNGELQIYAAPEFTGTGSAPLGLNPFSFSNGVMTISATPVNDYQSSQMWGYHYASGMLESNVAQTYGYFEMRAQLPHGQGLWPAFWLAGDNQKEIDVLEGLGSDTKTANNAIHSPTVPALGNASFNPYGDGFHTYGVLWDPAHITYYIDGAPVWQTNTPAEMNTPMHMIVNLAVGGNWPGSPDATTPWPAQMQVDYVRAYNLPTATGAVSTTPADTSTPSGSTASTGSSGSTASAGSANVVLTATDTAGQVLTGGAGNDTLIASHTNATLTGGAGADTFAFKVLPWNAGHITDFTVGTDKLDLSALYTASNYAGSDPVADGYLIIASNGSGGTTVSWDSDGRGAGNPWPATLTTLDHVSATGLTAAMLMGTSQAVAGGSVSTGSTGGSTASTGASAGLTLTATDSPGQILSGGAGNDTLVAAHSNATLTGGAGADNFTFNVLPWSAGHVTDFVHGTDKLDLTALFSASHYSGADPVGDAYVRFVDTGSGSTAVYYDSDGRGGADQWGTFITTLDHVSAQTLGDSDLVLPGASSGSTTTTTTTSTATPGVALTAAGPNSVLAGGAGDDTLNASRGADTLTGGAGADHFVFQVEPWAPAHITDFKPGTDVLDLRAIFATAGYHGSDPIADHYLSFIDDGAGGTKVLIDPDGPAQAHPWPDYIIDIENVAPAALHPSDYLFH